MSNNEHATEFAGKPVKQWEPQTAIENPSGTVYSIALSYEEAEAGETWEKKFAAFLSQPAASEVTGIVVGVWGNTSGPLSNSGTVIKALVAASQKLPNLRALFIGDIISEEFEISWIEQTDVSSIFDAYRRLEHFR